MVTGEDILAEESRLVVVMRMIGSVGVIVGGGGGAHKMIEKGTRKLRGERVKRRGLDGKKVRDKSG